MLTGRNFQVIQVDCLYLSAFTGGALQEFCQ